MSTDGYELVAVAFDDEYKADEARLVLRRAQGEGLIELVEMAAVVKARDGKLRLSQDSDQVTTRRTQGHWLGILAAVVTGVQPLILVGTAAGAVVGKITDKGIGNKIMKEIGEGLTPGASALFALGNRTTHRDAILERLRPLGGKVAHSTLDPSDEQELTAAFERAQENPA